LFETWEFDTRHRAGYLSDVDFFNREFEEDEEYECEDDEAKDHDDEGEDEYEAKAKAVEANDVHILGANNNGDGSPA
jgi:hypothetical protein